MASTRILINIFVRIVQEPTSRKSVYSSPCHTVCYDEFMKKIISIIVIILLVIVTGGLVATGRVAGLGPFAFLKPPAVLSSQEYAYSTEEVSIQNGEQRIYGVLYRCETTEAQAPIVILSHGYNSSYQNFAYTARSLASSGLHVYAYDFCGGSSHSKSDGETTGMSVLTEESDLNTVIDTVKGWDFVDADNLFLLGESQGGAVSALVAAGRDDIQAIVLYYPALSIVDDAHHQYPAITDIPNGDIKFMGMTISRKYYEDVYDLDMYGEIARYTNPVLIIHGTKDTVVDYSYSVKADETYENSRLVTIEGSGHGFYKDDARIAVTEAYRFIEDNLQ